MKYNVSTNINISYQIWVYLQKNCELVLRLAGELDKLFPFLGSKESGHNKIFQNYVKFKRSIGGFMSCSLGSENLI